MTGRTRGEEQGRPTCFPALPVQVGFQDVQSVFASDIVEKPVRRTGQQSDPFGQEFQTNCRSSPKPYLQLGQAVFKSKPGEDPESLDLPAQCNFGNELRRQIEQLRDLFKICSKVSQVFKSQVTSVGLDLF